MDQQQIAPRRVSPVVPAIVAFVIAAAAFAAAFWALDGASVTRDLFERAAALVGQNTSAVTGAPQPERTPGADEAAAPQQGLVLPPGMPQEFALRLWQEQVDSQQNITKLVSGDVSSLRIEKTSVDGDVADLRVRVVFADGTAAPGLLRLRRFGDVWYVASVTGMRTVETNGDADGVSRGDSEPSDLPSVEDVDVALLNTLIEQQRLSAKVTQEYVDGIVKSVAVDKVVTGQGTVTLKLHMEEAHGDAKAQLVAVRSMIEGKPHWFVVRFRREG